MKLKKPIRISKKNIQLIKKELFEAYEALNKIENKVYDVSNALVNALELLQVDTQINFKQPNKEIEGE